MFAVDKINTKVNQFKKKLEKDDEKAKKRNDEL